jgi:hypothetical protein
MTIVTTIRVTVEPSHQTVGRACLKAVDNEGRARLIVENLLPEDACRERNRLLDELVSSGQYDEVIGDVIQRRPAGAPLKPWVRRPGDPDPCQG